MHHVELLPDPAADAAVRAEWAALDGAGLPSQARHPSPSNRPHVTLTMTDGWPDDERRRVVLEPLSVLPLTSTLGAPVVFGRGPFVLARLVVVTAGLLALQETLAGGLGPLASPLLRAGRWVPHVTLARRMDAAQVAEALGLLGPEPGEMLFVAARHWDSGARLDEPLTPPRGSSAPRSVEG